MSTSASRDLLHWVRSTVRLHSAFTCARCTSFQHFARTVATFKRTSKFLKTNYVKMGFALSRIRRVHHSGKLPPFSTLFFIRFSVRSMTERMKNGDQISRNRPAVRTTHVSSAVTDKKTRTPRVQCVA